MKEKLYTTELRGNVIIDTYQNLIFIINDSGLIGNSILLLKLNK